MTTDLQTPPQTAPLSSAPAHDEPLLQVKDLHTWFELRRWGFGHAGHVRAVDGVTFDLHRGEAVAVVGESGCGKSSLMKTILGLHRPTRGEVFFAGRALSKLKRDELRWYRSQVGYVQQDPFGALPPFLNVRRILEEPLIVNGVKDRAERERRVQEVMEEVRLLPVEDFITKFPHQISGGQQQRVVIARAMILRPQLIVADEPVSMLDASVRVEILRLLQRLQRDHNIALIYITHDLSTVRYFTRRVFVMYAGKIIEEADVDDLLEQPHHPYARALLSAIPDPDPQNALIMRDVPPGEPPSLVNPPPGCRFHPRCPQVERGLCDVKVPPDIEVAPGHRVKCWLYD
ncbi:MAG: ABC transporter ATP-binding protein [Caldilineae bacterium]|nr:MAG: ABC transporter ATP-binding protein [Caldilineae bacterium]